MSVDMMLFGGSAVLLAAVLAARLGSRFGLPSLLLFLLLGMLLDPLGFHFDDAELAHALGFAALVFILGEGGFTTRWVDIKGSLTIAGLLATLGVLVSIAVTAVFCVFVLKMSLAAAVLVGAITAPTDSAAVFSVLRSVPLPARVRSILEGESGLNDAPIVLLVGVTTAWSMGELPEGGPVIVAVIIVLELVGGVLLGLAVGFLGARVLKSVALPASGLYPLAAMGVVVFSYGLGVFLHVSGFAAVYVCALILGNSSLPHRNAARSFAEGVGWVSQIGLFVMLGVLSTPERLTLTVVVQGLLLGLVVTFVARPLSVFACSVWFRVPVREQIFISWAGLRGAVPIIMATVPLAARAPDADDIFDAVFVFVVIFTLVQGPSLGWAARALGVAERDSLVDIEVEVAPLDRIQADFLQIKVPRASRLHGVTIQELRLPKLTVVSTIIRDGQPMVPPLSERIREGDELLIVVPAARRHEVEERFRKIGRSGRLATWSGE